MEIVQGIKVTDGAELRVVHVMAHLPLQTMDLSEAEAKVMQYERQVNCLGRDGSRGAELSRARFWLRWAEDVRDTLRGHVAPLQRQAELQAIRLGEGVLLGLPAEVFTEVGSAVKAQSPFPHTLLVTYANGDVGYIPTEQDFEAGGYAATMAPAIYDHFPFTPDVGMRLVEATGQLLEELTPGRRHGVVQGNENGTPIQTGGNDTCQS